LLHLSGGLVSRRNSERTIQIENITQERAKWRDKLRELAHEVQQAATEEEKPAKLEGLFLDFSLNLNPFDEEDEAILNVIRELSRLKPENREQCCQEFFDRLALLLKYDWERAKREAKPWSFLRAAPARTPYAEFKARKH
jgi:hypothetical protein